MTIAYQRLSVVDTAQMTTQKFPMLATHSLEDFDRLGNEEIDFPIGMCFGDSDFMGTEGAWDIVEDNKHFESGRSQIFKIKNATHRLDIEKPVELPKLMIDFFEGNVTGVMEKKPKYEIASAPFPMPTRKPVSKFQLKAKKRQSVFF